MDSKQKSGYLQDLYEAREKILEINYAQWLDYVLFSFNWWFLVVLTIVPWIIWWRLVDKKRILEISFMGTLVMITAVTIDVTGFFFLLWTYFYNDILMMPLLIPFDLTVLPILYMLVYQLFPKWKSYFITLVLFAAGGSFIVEPLFVWMNIYSQHGWNHIFSFSIYIAFGIVFKLLIQKMKTLQSKENANTQNEES
jgi:hypothetical protein